MLVVELLTVTVKEIEDTLLFTKYDLEAEPCIYENCRQGSLTATP